MGEAGIFSEEEAGKVFAVIKVCSVALRKCTFFSCPEETSQSHLLKIVIACQK